MSDLLDKVEFRRPIIPIIVTPFYWSAGKIWMSSMVSPLFETINTTSSLVIIPWSPWVASPGWTKWEGVPVEAMVEAIFGEINPDFPMPETISHPEHYKMDWTADSNWASMRSPIRETASALILITRFATDWISGEFMLKFNTILLPTWLVYLPS